MNQSLCKVLSQLGLVIIGLFIVSNFSVFGQKGTPAFLKQTEWLDANDLKKWEKNIQQLNEADKLLIQSNDAYLKIGSIDIDGDIDKSKKEKQIAKYEKEAAELYKNALIKYKYVYYELYKILVNYIDEPLKAYPVYNEMEFGANQANQLYLESGKVETDLEKEQLSQANELQLASLEKGISLFTAIPVNSVPQSISTDNNNLGEEEIVFDTEFYQKYKSYISDNSISDPVVISQLMQLEGDDAAFAAFEQKWKQYISNEEITLAQKEEKAEQLLDSLVASQNSSETTEVNDKLEVSQVVKTDNNNESIAYPEDSEDRNSSNQIVASLISASKVLPNSNIGYEFRVQVAASKVQLTNSQVAAIYGGDLSLLEYKEGNYYKYQIRGFVLFSNAQSVCSNSGVDNAYIAAYKNFESASLANAVNENRKFEMEVDKHGRQNILRPIEFSVQVAASRERLSEQQINNIYTGAQNVDVIFEEGWYKYQILSGKDIQSAFNILENCGVKKAFLVAYKNGQKLTLYKALNEYKTYK